MARALVFTSILRPNSLLCPLPVSFLFVLSSFIDYLPRTKTDILRYVSFFFFILSCDVLQDLHSNCLHILFYAFYGENGSDGEKYRRCSACDPNSFTQAHTHTHRDTNSPRDGDKRQWQRQRH